MAEVSFKDSYGNEIADGDMIVIESFYKMSHRNGMEAKVRWNSKQGMYMYYYPNEPQPSNGHFHDDDFWGVARFKKI